MISVVISEKGGAERRVSYDQHEITIGRVKGNDVLLPKGNVSKRHARLILRDGRYIVTDLKSTNGTYVNHRRITHATLVREGDRIYIGDFVLRIEGEGESSVDDRSGEQPLEMPLPAQTGHPDPSVAQQDVVSHFPIEHDPDEDSSPSVDVPAPPRIPSMAQESSTNAAQNHADPPHTSEGPEPVLGPLSPATGVPASGATRSSKSDVEERLAAQQQAHDRIVVEVERAVGVEPLAAVEPDQDTREKVDRALEAALEEVSLPDGVDAGALRASARLELLGLGPLGPLLEDEHVTKIQVIVRQVTTFRRGHRLRPAAVSFATEAGVARALSRLCAREEVSLPEGAEAEVALSRNRSLYVVRPEASPAGHLAVIESPHRTSSSLDDLVRAGAISRGMATLLSYCMAARVNLLVTGSLDSGADELVEALAGAIPPRDRILWLSSDDQPAPEGSAHLPLNGDAEARRRALAAATRLACEHLIVPTIGGEALGRILEEAGRGIDGLLVRCGSGTLRQGMHRLAAELAASRPGLTVPTAREWLGATFGLGIEVTRVRDGRLRVLRVAEMRDTPEGVICRNVFSFAYQGTAVGGSVEGAFHASGSVPLIVEELGARGFPLDTSLFRRHPSS